MTGDKALGTAATFYRHGSWAEPQGRRLAAIASVDMVGFGARVSADESKALRIIQECKSRLLKPAAEQFDGQLAKTTGDGALFAFLEATSALKAAIFLQNETRRWLGDDPTAPVFRVGIHAGEVTFEPDGDLYGDVVNIAVRLEGAAHPGGILVSETIKTLTSEKLPIEYQARGELRLKNIQRPIQAFDIVLPDLPDGSKTFFSQVTRRPVIAALPFSGSGVHRKLLTELAAELIRSLAKYRTIDVVAFSASKTFPQDATQAIEVARKLSVDYLFMGSLRKHKSHVRATVELVGLSTRRVVWSEHFLLQGHGEDDTFSTAEVIATASYPRIEEDIVTRAKQETIGAFDYYLKAKMVVDRVYLGPRTLSDARDLLEKAIGHDPQFAPSYSLLARVRNLLGMYIFPSSAVSQVRLDALQLAESAIRLDPFSPWSHCALGWCQLRCREFSRSKRHFDEAVKLNSTDPDLLIDIATALVYMGEFSEAVALMERAFSINSHPPDFYYTDISKLRFFQRRPQEAVDALARGSRVLQLNELWIESASLACMERFSEAARAAEQSLNRMRQDLNLDVLSFGQAEWTRWLDEHLPIRRETDRWLLKASLSAALATREINNKAGQ